MPQQIMKKKQNKKPSPVLTIIILTCVICAVALIYRISSEKAAPGQGTASPSNSTAVPDWVDVRLIDVDGASRSGKALDGVKDIVTHYVANPGSTAEQNRNYFNNASSNVSSHFIVGLDGEIIQCIPLNERSAASNDRNHDTISIEVCHPDETGKFNTKSYDALVRLTAWLCDTYHLNETHVIRHYDVTGKLCPLYFVEHEDAWEQFRKDVANAL